MIPKPRVHYGQTLYISSEGALAVQIAVRAWYNQIIYYNFQKPEINKFNSYFVQLMWRSTTDVGIGQYLSATGKSYIVAFFTPIGNSDNSLPFNILPITSKYRTLLIRFLTRYLNWNVVFYISSLSLSCNVLMTFLLFQHLLSLAYKQVTVLLISLLVHCTVTSSSPTTCHGMTQWQHAVVRKLPSCPSQWLKNIISCITWCSPNKYKAHGLDWTTGKVL